MREKERNRNRETGREKKRKKEKQNIPEQQFSTFLSPASSFMRAVFPWEGRGVSFQDETTPP